MTSLIFWGPYLAHKGVISHRREKQRIKNYERWEGLRDDYDEQRRITRETRSLDIQRTGNTWDDQPYVQQPTNTSYLEDDRHPITLRDQQEANDARTGWRPQECWEGPRTQLQAQMTGQVQQVPQPPNMHTQPQRHVSMTPTMAPQMTGFTQSNTSLPLRSQKTGATWDEGLPTPLPVSRQSFEDYDHSQRYRTTSTQSMPVSRDASLNRQSSNLDPLGRRESAINRTSSGNLSRQASISRTQTPSGLRESIPANEVQQQQQHVPMPGIQRMYSPPETQVTSIVELPKNEFGFVDPARIVAGGRMAELIERGY